MKRSILLLMALMFLGALGMKAQNIQPYYKVGEFDKSATLLGNEVIQHLTDAGYTVLGVYHPENKDNLLVISYTNKALKDLSLQFPDRGALASILKAAIIQKQDKSTLSILNPEYMFLAYWGKQLKGQKEQLSTISNKVVQLFSSMGTLEAFGGQLDKKDLPKYHYKIFMPYFDNPDELADFDSFEEGLRIIRKNLAAKKGNTLKVYEQVFPKEKIAVFGVGLMDPKTGEPHFLPIIGESHIAAMPYQIILQGKQATSLPGKYRLALYWPELTMGTFMKIMSSPGEIETSLKALTKE